MEVDRPRSSRPLSHGLVLRVSPYDRSDDVVGSGIALCLLLAQIEPGSKPLTVETTTVTPAITATTAVASSTVAPPGDAWELYHDAFIAIVHDDEKRGATMLKGVVAGYPDHPAAELAAEVLSELERRAQLLVKKDRAAAVASVVEPDDPFAPEAPSTLARAELGVFQTINGISVGTLLCFTVKCDDARLFVVTIAVGGAAGLTAALLGTEGGITPGRAQAIDAGMGWGVFNGITLAIVADAEDEAIAGTMMAMQLLGTGAGIAVSALRNPRGGDVSLATSLGLWSGVITLFVHAAAGFEADGQVIAGTLMLLADLGLVAGAVLGVADVIPMTRGRVLLIDAGGIVGGAVGMGLPVLIQGDDIDREAFFVSAIIGTISGLALTTWLTRHWDVPEDVPDIAVGLVPAEGGGGSVVFGGRF